MRPEIPPILDWLRADFGIDLLDLPKGELGSATQCPIARALRTRFSEDAYVAVDFDGAEMGASEFGYLQKVPIPDIVSMFIDQFDDGLWPEYEEDANV